MKTQIQGCLDNTITQSNEKILTCNKLKYQRDVTGVELQNNSILMYIYIVFSNNKLWKWEIITTKCIEFMYSIIYEYVHI